MCALYTSLSSCEIIFTKIHSFGHTGNEYLQARYRHSPPCWPHVELSFIPVIGFKLYKYLEKLEAGNLVPLFK
jgi:hypothetical protein